MIGSVVGPEGRVHAVAAATAPRYGELGTTSFATVAEELSAPLGPPPAPHDLDDPEAVEAAFDSLDEQRRALTRQHGQRLARRLLAGGRMKASSDALQRLIDERGADLAGIVLDDCRHVVGVGDTTQVPPVWLRRAIWARDVTVRDPDGSTPIRRADLDHVTEWPDGATDVSNLHPLGRRWHNHNELFDPTGGP